MPKIGAKPYDASAATKVPEHDEAPENYHNRV
jgi:hypothetical protein